MSRGDELRLDDIRDMCRETERIVQLGRSEVEMSSTLGFALERTIEIAGEAATRLTEGAREEFPGVAWKELIGFRVVLAVTLTRDLLAADIPVDRVDIQGHLTLGEPDWDLIDRTIAGLAELGVTVGLTEVDVPATTRCSTRHRSGSEEQAVRTGRLVRLCLDEPRCASVTFWGLDDSDTWLTRFIGPETQPMLFDEGLQPKAMYRAVLRELVAGR